MATVGSGLGLWLPLLRSAGESEARVCETACSAATHRKPGKESKRKRERERERGKEKKRERGERGRKSERECLTAQRSFADHCPRVVLHGPSRGTNSWGLIMSVAFLLSASSHVCRHHGSSPESPKPCYKRISQSITDHRAQRRQEKGKIRKRENEI